MVGNFGESIDVEPCLLCDRADGVGVYGIFPEKYAASSGSESDSAPYNPQLGPTDWASLYGATKFLSYLAVY